MLYPEINKLRDAAGSRYYLVSMASKRARDIIDGRDKLDESINTNKPVSIAAEEIAKDLFTYHQVEVVEDAEEEEYFGTPDEEAVDLKEIEVSDEETEEIGSFEETEATEADEEETYTPDYGQADENLPEETETGENQSFF